MPAKVLQIAAAQLKFRRTLPENVELIRRLLAEAARAGSDVVLFPECALTGYSVDFHKTARGEIENGLKAVSDAARAHRCHVVIGSPTFARGHRFNSLLVFDRQGRERFRYHKIHLTQREVKFFKPGNSIAYFYIDGVPCTAIICHERRFPELVRLPVMMGAVFYVFANSVGPQGGGLWSAGDSKIVAPDSRVLALANSRDEMLIHARLNLSQAGRKYARDALRQPAFLRGHWKAMLAACRRQLVRQH